MFSFSLALPAAAASATVSTFLAASFKTEGASVVQHEINQ